MTKKFRVRVPASTANLGPGFDTLGVALQLYLYLEVEIIPTGLSVELTGEGAEKLPENSDNLIYRTMKSLFDKAGFEPPGLKLQVHNQIPLQKGLGSSAAAIVSGLVAANELCGLPYSRDELLSMAVELEGHADNVTPALFGGLTISYLGQNGKVGCRKVTLSEKIRLVLVIPEICLSTSKARTVLPKEVPLEDAVFNVQKTAILIEALRTGNFNLLGEAMQDRLHQPYRKKLVPQVEKVFSAGLDAGACGVVFSGSGPTIAAFCQNREDEIGKAMKKAFEMQGVAAHAYSLEIDHQGAEVSHSGGCGVES